MDSVTFTLKPLPPFRLDLTVWVLRRRPDNLLDRWDGTTYRRALVLRGRVSNISVRQVGTIASPALLVTLSALHLDADMANEAATVLERMLGLRTDLSGFYDLAARDRELLVLAERFRGMKPPRFPTLFEGFINAVACQQLTLTFGIQLLNRLVHTFGPLHSSDADAPHAFPRPEDVAGLDPAAFRSLGFSRRKGETLIDTALNLEAMKVDFMVVRHSVSGAPEMLARSVRAHVVNAGDGNHEHPTQGLLDLMTMRQRLGNLKGKRVTIIGDIAHSRVARSNIWALTKLGAKVTLCLPAVCTPFTSERTSLPRTSYTISDTFPFCGRV